MPASFWLVDSIRDALASWHMGVVIAAYRNHPYHGRPLRQETVAGWVGITQAQLSRVENGPPLKDLDRLVQWARALGIPAHLLWFKLPEQRTMEAPTPSTPSKNIDQNQNQQRLPSPPEIDDMNRRELLRLLSMSATLLPTSRVHGLGWERPAGQQGQNGEFSRATIDEYAEVNRRLWSAYAASTSKSATFPAVRQQLGLLVGELRRPNGPTAHRRLCALTADLLQLSGEIFFDRDQYTEAAHCYTLAATAGREAEAFDLWACAMVRHAFVSLYERQFSSAAPLLELATALSKQGDSSLSTRHWASAVHAQALAGLGDLDGCRRALDTAEEVQTLDGDLHNGGWLRFDGSRLAEERGTCYVELRRPDLAEDVLLEALSQNLSVRRRGSVLTDLAIVGAQRRDPVQLVMYAEAALDTARQTKSGVVARRLSALQGHLGPFLADSHVRHLDNQITALATAP